MLTTGGQEARKQVLLHAGEAALWPTGNKPKKGRRGLTEEK